MKKKLLFIVMMVISIVAACVFAVACGDDKPSGVKEPTDRTVTVADYDDYRGTVTVEDDKGNAKTVFKNGATVIVSAQAKTGFAVVSFTVNGEKKALEGGKYEFKITADAEIAATFGLDAMGQEVLDASKANLHLSGTYDYTEEGQKPTTFTKTTVFGTDSIYLQEVQEDGTASIDEAYIDRGGVLTAVTHTIHNEIKYVPVSGESFEDYYNPFALLTPEDFELTDKADVFSLKEEKRPDASMPMTGWYDLHLGRFEVTVSGGKITYIEIETDEKAAISGTLPYHSLYKFTATGHGEAELDEELLTPFKHKDEHDVLRTALMEMSVANNYTVNIKDSEVGYLDILYSAYVTEDIIYEDCEDYENGYVLLDDQKVYPFDYNPDPEDGEPKVTLYDSLKNITSIPQLNAKFIGGYEMELFKLTEDSADGKVFTLRCNEFAGDIFQEFGDGLDKMKYYSYAQNGKIMLDDEGKLASAEFDCYVYGSYSTVTLIYSDIGTTEMPLEIDFSDVAKVTMYDSYVGTYIERFDEDFVVEISVEGGIVIDGTAAEVISYSRRYDIFDVLWKGEELFVGRKTAAIITIYDLAFANEEVDGLYYEFVLDSDEEVVIKKAYRGEWTGVCYFEQEHVGENVYYDGGDTNLITCTFPYLGDCVIQGSVDDEIAAVTVTITDADGEETELLFSHSVAPEDRFDGEIIPLKYTGGYTATLTEEGHDNRFILAVTNDEIVLTIYGESDAQAVIDRTTVTLVEGENTELRVLSCDDENGLVCYHDGYTFYFKLNASGEKMFVTIADGAYLIYDQYVFEDKQNGEEDLGIPDIFMGTWEGEDAVASMTYTVVVTEDGITLKTVYNHYVESDILSATITEVDEYYVTFFVRYYDEKLKEEVEVEYSIGDMYGNVYLYNDDIYVKLTAKQGGSGNDPVDTEIPDEFVGKWVGEDEEVSYTVIITKEKITVQSLAGSTYSECDATVTGVESSFWGTTVIFTLYNEDEIYTLADLDETTLIFACEINNVSVDLTYKKESLVHEKFYGDYMFENEAISAMICIDEDGVTIFMFNDEYYEGDEITFVSCDDSELVFHIDGVRYYVSTPVIDDDGKAKELSVHNDSVAAGMDLILYRVVDNNGDDVEIAEDLYGTYMGDGYYIDISADGVDVMTTADSVEHQVVVTECAYVFGSWILNLTVDGVDYSFFQDWEDETGATYVLSSEDAGEYTLTKL